MIPEENRFVGQAIEACSEMGVVRRELSEWRKAKRRVFWRVRGAKQSSVLCQTLWEARQVKKTYGDPTDRIFRVVVRPKAKP